MWLIVLLPVLAQYKVGPLDLDTVLMAAFFLMALIFRKYLFVTPVAKKILLVLGYITLTTVTNLIWGQKFSPASEIILRAGRYCLYLFVVFFLGNDQLDYRKLMKVYRIVAYAATIYIVIQSVMYYGAGIVLPNRIGGSTGASEYDVGRLRAFYSEPAELGYSLVPFIACSLFPFGEETEKRKNSIDAILVSGAIILSTSGQGILCTAAVWALWIFMRIKNGQFKLKDFGLLMGVAVVAVVLYKIGILKFALERASNTGEGGAMDARSSGYDTFVLLSPLQKVFGAGFGNYVVKNTFGLDVFYEFINYSTISEFLFTLGYVGVFVWVVFFFFVFKKGTLSTKVLVIIMTLLSTGGCPMTGKHFPLWLTLMCVQLPAGQFSRKIQEKTE